MSRRQLPSLEHQNCLKPLMALIWCVFDLFLRELCSQDQSLGRSALKRRRRRKRRSRIGDNKEPAALYLMRMVLMVLKKYERESKFKTRQKKNEAQKNNTFWDSRQYKGDTYNKVIWLSKLLYYSFLKTSMNV